MKKALRIAVYLFCLFGLGFIAFDMGILRFLIAMIAVIIFAAIINYAFSETEQS